MIYFDMIQFNSFNLNQQTIICFVFSLIFFFQVYECKSNYLIYALKFRKFVPAIFLLLRCRLKLNSLTLCTKFKTCPHPHNYCALVQRFCCLCGFLNFTLIFRSATSRHFDFLSYQVGQYSKARVSERRRIKKKMERVQTCLLYTSPSPRDGLLSRMPSSA